VRDFMMGAPNGFGSLEEVADAIAAYNPHRPRPRDLEGLKKNVRQREDGRWIWHWDPRMMTRWGDDETRVLAYRDRVTAAAQKLTIPTLLVRGGASDLILPEDVEYFLELVPHAETVEVPGAGHMVAGDRNDIFTDAIMPFLRRHA
jgi:non-heme chloroperoxidase